MKWTSTIWSRPMTQPFVPARSAAGAEWVGAALRRGAWTCVSGVIPRVFEAYAVVRHHAHRCVCTDENLGAFRAGYGHSVAIRWSDVAESNLPVVYGHALYEEAGVTRSRLTQYRRLAGGGWIVDELAGGDLVPLIRSGDAWIGGPSEGSLAPDLARSLKGLLATATANPDSCWFGIWEGYGHLTESQREAPAISAPARRWHLFRAPLTAIDQSFFDDGGHLSANLIWPEDRSWCIATEIDAEATYIAGSEELVARVLATADLEAERVSPDRRLASLRDVLQPVVDLPPGASLRPGFEGREYPSELRDFESQFLAKLATGGNLTEWLRSFRRKPPASVAVYTGKRRKRPPEDCD
ncbi:MAG: hypothetical protein OXQ86_05940 [Gammaproteobacteria bacterium]|nr:hypothetical protein [Gammaproteobacteria bacterium]MDE0414595.1 hypothetical protein [Gammaproteobacteria bacterium]